MSKPTPYYILVAGEKDENGSLFEFDTAQNLRAWCETEDAESPLKFNAKYLGTVFRPSQLTSEFLDSLQGFEDLFVELADVQARKKRAHVRRNSFNNRPNRRGK